MRAAYYRRTGPARDVLELGELPDPAPARGEVRVRIRWSGVNPNDVKTRAGLRSAALPFECVVPHSDGAGVIDRVGDGVAPRRVGERVWIWNGAWQRAFGTAAQYIVVPEEQAVALPDSVGDDVGACLGIPALTALHAVLTAGGVDQRSVLVAGGAGAVGHYAIQFARLCGARQVLTTVSGPAKAELARSAGADVVIDYRRESVGDRIRAATDGRGVDRIIEVDAAANGALDVELIRPEGDCVVYGSSAPQFALPFFGAIVKNLTLRCFIVFNVPGHERRAAIETLTSFLRDGKLSHNIAARVPLDDIAGAHELLESARAVGNVIVEVP